MVRRFEMGMPCHDVEILLAETQLATADSDEMGRKRRGRIAQTLADMLADAREQVYRDQPGTPPPPHDETPAARHARLLDSECAVYRKRHEVALASCADRHPPQSPPDAPHGTHGAQPSPRPDDSAQASHGDDTAPDAPPREGG